MLACYTAFWCRPAKSCQIGANPGKAGPTDVPANALRRRRRAPRRDREGRRGSHIGTGVSPSYQRYFYCFGSNNLRLRRDSSVSGVAEHIISFGSFRLLRPGTLRL